MSSTHASLLHNHVWPRTLVAALLLASPSAARAQTCGQVTSSSSSSPTSVSTTFAPGALVIPMDSCYNPDATANSGPKNVSGSCSAGPSYTCYNSYTSSGNLRLPFGILYLLAINNIPVNIILNQSKLGLTDADFTVTPPTGSTTPYTVTLLKSNSTGFSLGSTTDIPCSTNSVVYSGMPFVVEAPYVPQALQILTNYRATNTEFATQPMHLINYPFTAPVYAVIASRPNPVIIDGSPLDSFFTWAGIVDVAGTSAYVTLSNPSSNTFSFNWPSGFTVPSACSSSGVCTTLTSGTSRIVDVVWTTENNLASNINNWSAVGPFFQDGGTVLAVDAAETWEAGSQGNIGGGIKTADKGDQKGPFCGALASTNANPVATPGPTSYYPASSEFFQIDDANFAPKGNGGGADNSSSYGFSSSPATGTLALGNSNGYGAITGHPKVSGTQTTGNFVYLASLHSWDGKSVNAGKDAGLKIMYNTLLAGNGASGASGCSSGELTRASAVSNTITLSSGTTAYAYYLGSFDWYYPTNTNAMGNFVYQPDPSSYPYLTGHFREYKPQGTYSSSATNTTCSSSSNSSSCDWDAASNMATFSNRNIYVATGSAGNWTLTTASSLKATDSTISYISGKLNKTVGGTTVGVLGGIDWSTAAVIEGRNVGGISANRPTIAYVGARDGMLHAFCVAPATGSTTCYGTSVGNEIWAIIPPGEKKVMDSAYSSSDWRKVDVGGVIRVADMTDQFTGSSSVTRTILLVGMHDSGYVDALDITNPDPTDATKLNHDGGLKFLWENDGTNVASGVTSMPMGPSNGATIAQVSTSGNATGVAVVTSATCYGQGMSSTTCPSSVTAGFNTYVLRLSDGVVVSDQQTLYTLTTPLGSPIANDAPAVPTVLDTDTNGSDETVYVSRLDGKIRQYTLTSSGATAPTMATIDSTKTKDVFNANTTCTTGTSCEPIGVSPSVVYSNAGAFKVVVATGGADWARQNTDQSDLTATKNLSYVTGFDVASGSNFPSTALSLGGIQPPGSGSAGTSPGITNVPVTLRAYAQLTVAGTDLYADVTSISIGSLTQLQQPLVTPGTYGQILKFSNISSTPSTAAYMLTQGTSFAGGAGSVLETNTGTSDGALFASAATSVFISGLSSGSSSLRNTAYEINRSSSSSGGNHPWTGVSWFDLE